MKHYINKDYLTRWPLSTTESAHNGDVSIRFKPWNCSEFAFANLGRWNNVVMVLTSPLILWFLEPVALGYEYIT